MRFATSRFAYPRFVVLAAIAVASAAGSAEARYAIEPVALREAGMLTCKLDSHGGLDTGSSRSVACVFQRAGRSEIEYYNGRMDHVGIDGMMDGRNQDSQNSAADVRSWIVSTPNGQFRPGMLAGGFIGSPADPSTNAGPDAKVFLNNRGESLLLDPYGWANRAPDDVADGAASMDLRAAQVGALH